MSSTRDTTKSKQRPPGPGTPIVVRLQPADLVALDDHITAQPEPQPTRPEAIRRVLTDYLNKNAGSLEPAESPDQRLDRERKVQVARDADLRKARARKAGTPS